VVGLEEFRPMVKSERARVPMKTGGSCCGDRIKGVTSTERRARGRLSEKPTFSGTKTTRSVGGIQLLCRVGGGAAVMRIFRINGRKVSQEVKRSG